MCKIQLELGATPIEEIEIPALNKSICLLNLQY